MGSLSDLLNKAFQNQLNQLNTLMLCEIISTLPLAIMPVYPQENIDGTNEQRSIIQEPINLDNKIYKVGDIVVVGFLQEVTEGGATRHFDITDAVILGRADKPGQYSGTARFAKYAKNSEQSKIAHSTGIVTEPAKTVPDLIGSDGKEDDWEW